MTKFSDEKKNLLITIPFRLYISIVYIIYKRMPENLSLQIETQRKIKSQ